MADLIARLLIVSGCTWVLIEYWVSRGASRDLSRKLLSLGSNCLVIALVVLYVGIVVGIPPWFGRTLVLFGLIVMALGRRQDRQDHGLS